MPFDELFKSKAKYLSLYEDVPKNEKPDFSLYCAMLAFADDELSKYAEMLKHANDWEAVELEERIGGLQFAKECLNEAWNQQGGVIQ